MADATLKGHWAGSSMTKGTILELCSAGYIPVVVATRAPDTNQQVPAPNPGERVVFVPHLIIGLGFPLHPFVHGIMF